MTFTYICPTVARFENSILGTLHFALIASINHLPYTIIVVLLTFVPILLSLMSWLATGIVFMIYAVLGIALTYFINSLIFSKILKNICKHLESHKKPPL